MTDYGYINAGNGSLLCYNLTTGALLATIATGFAGANGVAISPDGQTAYLAISGNGINGTVAINLSTQSVSAPRDSSGPMATSLDGTRLYYVTSSGSGSGINTLVLPALSATSGEYIAPSQSGGVAAVSVSPDGRLYTLRADYTVDAITASTRAVTSLAVRPAENFATSSFSLSPDGTTAYVTGSFPGNPALYLFAINLTTGAATQITASSIGAGAYAMSISPDGGTAYGLGGGSIQVINIAAGTIARTISIPSSSNTIAVSSIAPPLPPPAAPDTVTFLGSTYPNHVPFYLPNLPSEATSEFTQIAPNVPGAGGAADAPGTWSNLPADPDQPGPRPGALFYDNRSSLTQLTTYWYRAVAVNSVGSTTGPASSYTTPGTLPPAPILGPGPSDAYAAPQVAVAVPGAFSYATNLALQRQTSAGDSQNAAAYTTVIASLTAGSFVYYDPPANPTTSVYRYAATETSGDGNPVLVYGPTAVFTESNFPPSPPPPPPPPPPAIIVSITAPASGANVQGLVPVTVQAGGGLGGVAKVELYVAGALVGTETISTSANTFTCLWDTTSAGNGPYVLTAKAYDHAAPPNTATSAPVSVNAANPDRLGSGYWFSALRTDAGGKTITQAIVTADLLPTTNSRALRDLLFGIHVPGSSFDFEKDYSPLALNEDFLLPGVGGGTYRLAAKLSQRYAAGPFTFTEQIVKMTPFGATALIWAASGKLYTFDGISAPVLLLDTAPLLLAGETLKDAAGFDGRVFLALSGGPAPLTSRLFAYDPAAGDESYTVAGFAGTGTALAATATALYLGTTEGYIHRLGADGTLKKVCGGTTHALPAGVVRLLPVELSATNTAPGVTAFLADGSAWDLDGSAVYGAAQVFLPPDGAAAAAAVADLTYLGSAGGGLYARGAAGFAPAYAFPAAVNALAGYGGTVYAGLVGDARLWGKVLSPGQHALAYGPATDPLGKTAMLAGLTSITALCAIGASLYVGGTAGSGENTLYEYSAPAANANAVFAQSFKHPALEVRAYS